MNQETLTVGVVLSIIHEAQSLSNHELPGPLARWVNNVLNLLEPVKITLQEYPVYSSDENQDRQRSKDWEVYKKTPSTVHSSVVPVISLAAHRLQDWPFQPKQIRHLQAFMY